MKTSFWALPAVLRMTVAAGHSFSVNEDLLAHPQFEIKFPLDYVSEQKAQAMLGQNGQAAGDRGVQIATSQQQDTTSDTKQAGEYAQYEYESLTMNNQRYLCSIPVIESAEEEVVENVTRSRQEQEKELERSFENGWRLLQDMQGRCIYYWSGWWSYRYCFGQGAKQFHQLPAQPGQPIHPPVEDPTVPGFELGTIEGTIAADEFEGGKELAQKSNSLDAAKAVGSLETKGETKYLVQRLAGGTVCDLTGKERKIEVQFHCSPSATDHIAYIQEQATCTYLMVINTPRLCSDVAFLPPQRDHPNPISCSPILKPEEVPAYKAKLAARAKKTIEQEVPNPLLDTGSPETPQRIGDIVIGAHKWIPEGREIERSSIVGGGKETFIDVIANSLGKSLTAEELKKLGIMSTKQVDALKKELKQIAGDQDWKLEVVDTPKGREYRGIIGEDEENESASADQKEITEKKHGDREEYEQEKFKASKEATRKARDRLKEGTKQLESDIEQLLNMIKNQRGHDPANAKKTEKGSEEEYYDEGNGNKEDGEEPHPRAPKDSHDQAEQEVVVRDEL